jgi:hypothetical protein
MLQCDLADKWQLYVSWRDLPQVATFKFLWRLLQAKTLLIFLARSASSGNFLISWRNLLQVATFYFLGATCFKRQPFIFF